MKFGIFYEHQLPKPWSEGQEQQLFQDALDQVELADRIWASTTPGRWSTTSWRSTPTPQRSGGLPRGMRPSARSASASATASS